MYPSFEKNIKYGKNINKLNFTSKYRYECDSKMTVKRETDVVFRVF